MSLRISAPTVSFLNGWDLVPGIGSVCFLCLSPALPLTHEFWRIKKACHSSNANGCLRVVSEHGINSRTLRNPLKFLLIQNANNVSHCTSNTFISFFMYSFQLLILLAVLFHKMLSFMIQNTSRYLLV